MKMLKNIINDSFLFEELVKRDFKQKYKRTVLGVLWSVLNPLLTLAIMRIVFTHFFGSNVEHYTIYLFCGTLIWNYFSESTNGGMLSLASNASIFSKINVPKYLFLLSKNVSTLINFGIVLCVFFIFCALDSINFSLNFISLIIPILCLIVFNIGIGLIVSACYVFFRDTEYLYNVGLQLLSYLSAIFYTIDTFPEKMQFLFMLNPVYVYIKYFRVVVLDGCIPSLQFNLLCIFYALISILFGGYIYKKYNQKFLYYI